MRIGVVQMNPRFGAVEENIDRALATIDQAKSDLWVLPELFATGYQFRSRVETRSYAEVIPDGPTTKRLIGAARNFDAFICAGLPEMDGEHVYNAAVLVGPDGLVGRYRKIHLFFHEKELFSPGNLPFPVVDIGLAKVGMMICFDHFFPEAARTLALEGAQVIAHPANLVMPLYAQLTMRVRALENGVFTATTNRVGEEARTDTTLHFTGESQIVSPRGEVLISLSPTEERAQAVEIDPTDALDKTLNPLNDRLADRRPSFY
ncbi:MAG: nitrilase-related carbon-nitrogen hydrolase [Candidatus Bipolaricaulota bacterium]|nr:nitrilase-related carbon-nitrogen hydrolase [Candidatus Bipolaricaulota bacterium]